MTTSGWKGTNMLPYEVTDIVANMTVITMFATLVPVYQTSFEVSSFW